MNLSQSGDRGLATMRAPSSLRVNAFDAVSSWLLAVLLFLASLVGILFLIWMFDSQQSWPVHDDQPILAGASGAASAGTQIDFEAPPSSEVAVLLEPSLAQTLQALGNLPAAAILSASRDGGLDGNSVEGESGDGEAGDGRFPGTGRAAGIPPWLRWELRFRANGKRDYANQLDHFQIELAAFGGGKSGLDIANRLSSVPTAYRNPDPTTEQRLYFSWTQPGPLAQYDRQLLASAGIDTLHRNVIRFIPKSLEQTLLNLERDYCEGNGRVFPAEIAKTIYQTNATADGYSFTIIGQRYRKP